MKRIITSLIFPSALLALGSSTASYAIEADTPYTLVSSVQGETVNIPESVVSDRCSNNAGCTLILAHQNYDKTGRTSSKSVLLHYNKTSARWRISSSGRFGGGNNGKNGDGSTRHVLADPWNACYFTDGSYSNKINMGDHDSNFGLLLWAANPEGVSATSFFGKKCTLSITPNIIPYTP